MRVLVLEEHEHAADAAEGRLAGAGIDVVRCHQPDDPAFPCAGMPGGPGCPIETTTVDVALTVGPSRSPEAPADGVRCSLRHHIPVVATGHGDAGPWASMVHTVDDADDLVGAVVHAAEAPLRRHSEVATVELGHVLGRKGIDAAGSTVTVERRTGGLHATLRPVVELPTPVVQAAAVRVAAALRAIDDKSSAVDVTVAPAPVGVG